MKQKQFFFLMMSICTFSLFACNNTSSSSGSKTDSTQSNSDTTQKKHQTKSVFANRKMQLVKESADVHFGILPDEARVQYKAAYMAHPIFNKNGDTVYGYMLQPGDFLNIAKLKNVKNIAIEFAIVDSTVSQNATTYTYSLMIVPVDAKNKAIPTVANYTAYDIVCPCINGKGCCPGN